MKKFKHVASGNDYTIVAEGKMESDQTPCVIYRNENDEIWVRPSTEFYDGRFKEIKESKHKPKEPK